MKSEAIHVNTENRSSLETKKILYIATTPLCTDGLTEVLIKIAEIATETMSVSFVLSEESEEPVIRKLEKIGTVYQLPSRSRNIVRYCGALRALTSKNEYHFIHIHGNSSTMVLELCAAAKNSISITHCHNCAPQPKWKRMILGKLMNKMVTRPAACGKMAGENLYTKPFQLLTNGIDCDRFAFSASKRLETRRRLGLEDAFVVGHIGRFSDQKNHLRLLSIFAKIAEQKTNARLLLCGDGINMTKCRDEAKRLGLEERVLFPGKISNPEDFYAAMDIFVLPSLFEGFPLVAVEAQANGLACVISDAVTKDAAILPQSRFVSLEASDAEWADVILNTEAPERNTAARAVEHAGYTCGTLRSQLSELYRD